MPIHVQPVPYGRAATEALHAAILRTKAGDPLAPVTVLVARGAVALRARRLLAGGLSAATGAEATTGLANVTFTTLPRLAEQLAGPALATTGRAPASGAVRRAAVRAVLAAAPGSFEPVRAHPATIASLAAVRDELRGASPAALAALAASSTRAAEVLRVVAAVDERLARTHHDVHDLLVAAASQLRAAGATPIPPVVVHLPDRTEGAGLDLLRALGEHTEVTILLGEVAVPSARRAGIELATALAGAPPQPPELDPLTAERFVRAPSADAEVLWALRTVFDELHHGTPLDRIAILYASAAPYARLLREELARNAVAHHGPGVRALASTVAGRTMLGLLDLPEGGWRRADVLAWCSAAPIRFEDDAAPAAAWDRASRAAGVVAGPEDWQERLALHARAVRLEAADVARDDPGHPRAEALEREAATSEALARFVASLVTALDAAPTASWRERARHAAGLLRDLLGGPQVWEGWDEAPDERQAVTEVLHALEQLAALDAVEPAPSAATFLQALRAELQATAPTTSRTGDGLLVAPLGAAVGLDLDLVLVLGMTDTALPGRRLAHPLLPDEERRAADPSLPLHAGHLEDAHHRFLAAAAAAPRRILCHPTGDLRSGRVLRPARWWLDALAATRGTGASLYAGDVEDLAPGDDLVTLPSFTAALLADGEPASLVDRDLRTLARHRLEHDLPVGACWLAQHDAALAHAFALRAERRAGRFTRFEGDVGALADPPSSFSPTSLQTYATCPRRYLFGRLLHVEPPVTPERILRLDPLGTGSLVHAVLEQFVRRQLAATPDQRIAPAQAWGPDDHAALDTLLDEAARPLVDAGLTGHPLLWEIDRSTIRRELHGLLEADDAHRAATGATPTLVEAAVGFDGEPPLVVRLPDGRALSFRGYIDRLDRTADGAAIVLDYKHARADRYRAVGDDPVARGTLLQPVLYGLMARQLFDDPGIQVQTGYWSTRAASGFEQVLVPLDAAAEARFAEVVGVLVAGIADGAFPARPGSRSRFGRDAAHGWEHCAYCEYATVCPGDRDVTWSRVRLEPRLASYVALAEPLEQEAAS